MTRLRAFLKRLYRNSTGIAMTEFALSMPFFLTAGLWGIELAHYSIVNMKVNQLAVHIADNSSRIGDTSMLQNRKIYEDDINDVLRGADIQAGEAIDIYENGRVIISSLQVYPDTEEQQYIDWQRCMGRKVWNSSYGNEGDGADGSLAGMGPTGEEVIAFDGEAVMFVEIAYDYQPIVSSMFARNSVIKAIAAFTVRSDRDLSQIYQRDPGDADPIAGCGVFENAFATASESASTSGGASGGGSSGGASSGGGGASSGGASSGGGGASSGGGGGT